MRAKLLWLPAALCLCSMAACSTAYYRTLETFGVEKRDILVDRVEDARDSQASAKDQFSSALDEYRTVVEFDGGDLEDVYDRLDAEYERSASRAEAVRERIADVRRVAEDLFEEWRDEIGEYSDSRLRRRSEALLVDTEREYESMLGAMERAERSMDPVLTLFNDQVLILRHSLNARAIGGLRTELDSIERATAELISEMERAIDEASRFVESMAVA